MIKKLIRSYQSLKPQHYLINQRNSNVKAQPTFKKLSPLPGANHSGDNNDCVTLVGCTKSQITQSETLDHFKIALMKSSPDVIFLQLDPSRFVARQRFLAHRCALNNVPEYHLQAIKYTTPIKLQSWQQAVVNLVTLEMLKQNKLPKQINYTNSYYTYAYQHVRYNNFKLIQYEDLTQPMVHAINDNVLGYGLASQYPLINKALFHGLMGKQRVLLGGMPQILYRMNLAGNLALQQLQDIFKQLKLRQMQLIQKKSLKQLAQSLMPHIFNAPKDLYMTALLKQIFQAATSPLSIVGLPHLQPINKYWLPPPQGINMTEATRINNIQQSDSIKIQKQALLDVILGTRLWSQDFVSNPFAYIVEDVTRITDKDMKSMKELFAKNYKKYKQQLKQIQQVNKFIQHKINPQDVNKLRGIN